MTIRLVNIVETSAPLWIDTRILLGPVFAAFQVKGAGPLKERRLPLLELGVALDLLVRSHGSGIRRRHRRNLLI
jgi:hypothetical protein